MAKSNYYRRIIFSSLGLFGLVSFGQGLKLNRAEKENLLLLQTERQIRQAWLDTARKESFVREKTNQNDHPRIALYNKVSHSAARAPYCAAGLNFTAQETGLYFPLKQPAAVRGWFAERNKVIYNHGRWTGNAQLMDVIWIFNSHAEALAQWDIPEDIEDEDEILTIGFNTSGCKKQQGVYYPIRRKWKDVRMISNHVSPQLLHLRKQVK